jgi:glutamine amidotransferase
MISILDYGMGNVGSIANMLKKVHVSAEIICTPEAVKNAKSIILPGVGHIDSAIERLESRGLRGVLDEAAIRRRIPILGICLGMQIMTQSSEEGLSKGFGWVPAKASRFDGKKHSMRVPHMGWNTLNLKKSSSYFDCDGFDEHRFYFVHSYAVQCYESEDVLSTTIYGVEFVSAFQRDNLTGVQFHPEKSHKFGESFFRRYVESIRTRVLENTS